MENKNNTNSNLSNENKLSLLLKKTKSKDKNKTADNDDNPKKLKRGSLVMILIIIIIGCFVLFYYILGKKDTDSYKVGYSFSPKDMTNLDIQPVIDKKTNNIINCIDEAKNTGNCSGITFNEDTYKCVGYKDGMLIKTSPNMYAWEKPKEKQTKEAQTMLLTNNSQQTTISASKLPFPYELYNFNFSFHINILDWYNSTHGYWKCVFLKGPVDRLDNKFNKIQATHSWEDIISQLPEQCIGVWLAPFNNNIRICITTEATHNNNKTYVEPSQQICANNLCISTSTLSRDELETNPKYKDHLEQLKDLETKFENKSSFNTPTTTNKLLITENKETNKKTYMEFYDILNVPMNKLFFLSVNVNQNIMEIYMDGKLNYIINLEGKPKYNKYDLNVKNEPTYNGSIHNLSFVPYHIQYRDIQKLYKIQPNLNTKL